MGGFAQRDAQAVLVVKALEESSQDVPSPELRRLASVEAGDSADRERWFVARAEYMLDRLPEKYASLARAKIPPRWALLLIVALSFAAGAMTNTLGPAGKIHAFYNPITLIIAWNLAAVVFLVVRSVFFPQLGRPILDVATSLLAAGGRRWASYRRPRGDAGDELGFGARFFGDYRRFFSSLLAARVAAWLIMASLSFTVGALLGMYLRGVAFGYNVVWRSTLVQSPETAVSLLKGLFYPAWLLTPQSFPGTSVAELLATPAGAPAGPWIHCFALTAIAYAILPRVAVLCWQQGRLRSLSNEVHLETSEPYFDQLLRGDSVAHFEFDNTALEGFALSASQYSVLASLEAGLIETDLRVRPRRLLPARDTLPKRNKWYPSWREVVEKGWSDAFPADDRPRFMELGSADFTGALERSRQTSNPFALELIALELAAFEAYWPLQPVRHGWLRKLKPGALPALSEEARQQFFAEVAGVLGLSSRFLLELRRDLLATSKELERFWLKLGMGILSGAAVGGLTLGIAAPFIGGLIGSAMGLGGAAAVHAGLAALGGGSLVAGGLGVAGGKTILMGGAALLGGLGTGAFSKRLAPSAAKTLSPAQALLSAVKIEVFLRRVVLPRDAEVFAGIVGRFQSAVQAHEEALHDLPLRVGVARKDIEEHEKALGIMKRSLARIEELSR